MRSSVISNRSVKGKKPLEISVRLVNNKVYVEYEAKRGCKWIICISSHRDYEDFFQIVSEAAEAGVGAQSVSCDVKREVFSG